MKFWKSFKNLFSAKKNIAIIVCAGLILGLLFVIGGNSVVKYTSTDNYCMSCHVHPHAEQSWKLSTSPE
jgi:nitrate/TMAO reductase-like tetraheme cytochrome c subunit